jgi:beta-1,4-mannosyl-glycoprotein beta-1,4-N-acetylglucosaminyltransferase
MLTFDCFLYCGEDDLLKLRLEELNDTVDYFVLTESTVTFSGKPKPLYFEKNQHKFDKFLRKIIYNPVDNTPEDYTNLANSNNIFLQKVNQVPNWNHVYEKQWGRESYQREVMIRPLIGNAENNDLVLISDLDEIPNKGVINKLHSNFDYGKAYHFQNKMYYYYLNCLKSEDWLGTFALSFENALNNSLNIIRSQKDNIIPGAGWHFSFMGGEKAIRQKIESFSHQEFNNDWTKDQILSRMNNLQDVFGRGSNLVKVPIDDSFPEYLVNHQEEYKDMIL